MKRKLIVGLVLLLVAGAIGYRLYTRGDGAAAGMGKGGPVPVVVEAARRTDVPVRLNVIGRAEASESVTVRARVDGQVKSVRFNDGQQVTKGEILAVLDDADFLARVAQAEANLARDQAELLKARADYERYSNPKTRAYVSASQLNQVQAAADAAVATVRADEAELTLARLQLEYTTVRAPISGTAGSRLLSPGALVRANETDIAVINTVSPIDVSFAVPEKNLPALRAALRRAPVKTRVAVSGDAGTPLEGVTRFVDNAVDATTGTIKAKATLPNRDHRLTPGQFVEVQLTLDTLRGAVVVPEAAVQQGPKGSFVYVVAGEAVQLRPVQVVQSDGGSIAVSGVDEGEQVVTDGHVRLTPGAKIKLPGKKDGAKTEGAKPEGMKP